MELFPDFDLDLVTISVPYPGAAPLEVEEGICKQIEEKIWDLSGIKEMNSFARENLGVVSIQVALGKDAKVLADEIKVRVDSISTFPEEAEKPMVEVATQKRRVLALAIHGNCDERSLQIGRQDTRRPDQPSKHYSGGNHGHPQTGNQHRGLRAEST